MQKSNLYLFKIIKNNVYLLLIVFLLFFTMLITNFYSINKKNYENNLRIFLDNIYLNKSLNLIINNLNPKYSYIDYEDKKGDTFQNIIKQLNIPLTEKDIKGINIAKKFNLKYYAMSFVNNENDIKKIRKLIGNNFLISKIETSNALKNLKNISKNSNALLIDRGDLSRYIPIEKIPIIQEEISNFTKLTKKPLYVATNLLETMVKDNQPTRAESHDIYSTLKQGVSGLVLAAETAIGRDPVNCTKFLKNCIKVFNQKWK